MLRWEWHYSSFFLELKESVFLSHDFTCEKQSSLQQRQHEVTNIKALWDCATVQILKKYSYTNNSVPMCELSYQKINKFYFINICFNFSAPGPRANSTFDLSSKPKDNVICWFGMNTFPSTNSCILGLQRVGNKDGKTNTGQQKYLKKTAMEKFAIKYHEFKGFLFKGISVNKIENYIQ